jgi:hypothetical protein
MARTAAEKAEEVMMVREPNISTEHQPKGSGRDPSDTLDRNADSRDYLNGGDGSERHEPANPEPDSTAAEVDDRGRAYPQKIADVRPPKNQGQSTAEPAGVIRQNPASDG